MKLLPKARPALDGAINFLAILSAVLVIFVLVTVSLGVVMRYFVHSPLNWVVETAEYSLVFITFMGAAWVLRMEKHVTMELVSKRLKPRNQDLLGIITSIIGVVICLVLVVYGTHVALDLFRRDVYELRVLDVPMAALVSCVPIGSFMLFLQFLRRSYGYLESWRGSAEQRQSS